MVNTEVARFDAVTATDVRAAMADRVGADNRVVLTYVPPRTRRPTTRRGMTTPNPKRPPSGEPRPYHFPAFTHERLPNGLTVWSVPLPDREVVSVHLLVDGGAAAESEAEAGIANLAAETLVTGTRRLDGHAFAEATERLGIEITRIPRGTWPGPASSRSPTSFEPGLALLAEMIHEPRFDEGEFDRLREERLADILQARSEPGRLADESFLRQCYPTRSRTAGSGRGRRRPSSR